MDNKKQRTNLNNLPPLARLGALYGHTKPTAVRPARAPFNEYPSAQRALQRLCHRLKIPWQPGNRVPWELIGPALTLQQEEFQVSPPKRKRGRPQGTRKTVGTKGEEAALYLIRDRCTKYGLDRKTVTNGIAKFLTETKRMAGEPKDIKSRLNRLHANKSLAADEQISAALLEPDYVAKNSD